MYFSLGNGAKTLDDAVLDEKRAIYESEKHKIFEDTSSTKSQAGLLKIEDVYARGKSRSREREREIVARY